MHEEEEPKEVAMPEGVDQEIIMSEDPRMQEAIIAVYMLYMDDKKADQSDEVTS